jgi:hypothetical protein
MSSILLWSLCIRMHEQGKLGHQEGPNCCNTRSAIWLKVAHILTAYLRQYINSNFTCTYLFIVTLKCYLFM